MGGCIGVGGSEVVGRLISGLVVGKLIGGLVVGRLLAIGKNIQRH